MDIRSNVESLKNLLGVPAAAPEQTRSTKNDTTIGSSALTGDRATLSSAGSEVALMASNSEIRLEKVAAVQAALAAGTYSIPAAAVAGKVIVAMLSGGSSND